MHHARSPRFALLLAALLAGWTLPAASQPRPPAPPASSPGATPPTPAASAPGLSDAVARCEAKPSALERLQCRRQLAHQAPRLL